MYDFFLYIGTLFNILYYVTDYYTAYITYKIIYDKTQLKENKNLNSYSLKIRICILVIDGSYYLFYVLNDIEPPIISYMIFTILDISLFFIRIWFAYILYYIVPKLPDIAPLIENTNPMHSTV